VIDITEKKKRVPIIGYTGHFLGKVDGIVGRPCSRGNIAISEREYRDDDLEVYKTTSNLSFTKFGMTSTTDSSSSSSFESMSGYSFSPEKKKYMTGYTGGSRFKDEPSAKPARNLIRPIIGYNGYYRGKVNGNLGRVELHTAPLSHYDTDVSDNILGDNNFARRVILKKK